MSKPVSIAVIQLENAALVEGLRRLPGPVAVRRFPNLYDDFEQLRDFHPALMFLAGEALTEADLGALRLLRSALPGSTVVLVVAREQEVALAELVQRARARVLLTPFTQRDLATVVSLADSALDQPSPETFLDLSRGISDEINNPLLFVSGHVQLLEAELDPQKESQRLAQVRAIKGGLERIHTTVEKIQLLSRAGNSTGPATEVPLEDLLRGALARVAGAADALQLFFPEQLRGHALVGNAELLPVALENFCSVGTELSRVCSRAAIVVSELDGGARIRLELTGYRLGDWQMPRTFEPYYLNRILRGTTHGLSLFLVQTILHAHGGQAFARRRPDGGVLLDLAFPRLVKR